MRRIAATILVIAAVVAVLASGSAAGGDDGTYQVRAIFDNTAFLVTGEEVRVAGANVGQVAEVDVTKGDEPVHEDGGREPGKAAVVLQIDDPGFQDFRADASCLIRPQSLLGEKFVECEPTQPRAAGSEPPPPLEVIEDGEPG
ncbi:MAG: MlaD family protein, partial [Solirubrobacterales bacterium]